jgi:ribonuclease R
VARRITGRSHGDPRTADTRAKVKDDYRPSRDEILRYIAENPDRAGKREIA